MRQAVADDPFVAPVAAAARECPIFVVEQAGVVYDLALSSRDKLEARLYAGDR